MNYFVTLKKVVQISNLNRLQAISTAKKLLADGACGLDVGIGKIKYVKGKRVYNLQPARFYL